MKHQLPQDDDNFGEVLEIAATCLQFCAVCAGGLAFVLLWAALSYD